jgi:signal peptidase II
MNYVIDFTNNFKGGIIMKFSVKNILMIITGLVLVLFDQITKLIATRKLQGKDPFVLVKDIFEFHYLEGGNKGAAWGMLSGQIVFFVIISVAISVAIVLLIIRVNTLIEKNEINGRVFTLFEIALVLLISGAVGNMTDRIVHGFVIDFLYFKLINFPIFNVADCYVTVSCVFLIILCAFVIKDEDFSKIFNLKDKKISDATKK